jgi:hypothetical protein
MNRAASWSLPSCCVNDDLRLTLRREGKRYSLTVENLTTSNSTTLTMPQPASVEGERDLHIGFFGANTQSETRRTLVLKEFKATVWTLVPGAWLKAHFWFLMVSS